MENNHKICTRCNELKILDNFRLRNNKAISSCKKCEKDYWNSRKDKTRIYNKRYRELNKVEISKLKKQKRQIKRDLNNNIDNFDLSLFEDIPNYENIYKIDKYGNVLSCPSINSYSYHIVKKELLKGYFRVSLWKNGKSKHFFNHRLVAMTYIYNPENKPQVNHIDGNKLNNHINNLEWCNSIENIHHSIENNLSGTNRCRKNKINTSGFVGVSYHKRVKKFQSRIILKNKKRLFLGYFDNPIDAAKAYDNALFKEWGTEYKFNFARDI